MRPHDELLHYGVLGMKWGVRKDNYARIEKAKKRADLKMLKVTTHDAKTQLKRIGESVDPNDIDAVKRYKLSKQALRAEIKAQKLAIKLREPASKAFSRESYSDNKPQYNDNRNRFNDRFQKPEFAQRVNSRPMSSFKSDGGFKKDSGYKKEGLFTRVLTEAAVKSAGTAASVAASKFIEPSAAQYGNQFVKYLVAQQAMAGKAKYVSDTWSPPPPKWEKK